MENVRDEGGASSSQRQTAPSGGSRIDMGLLLAEGGIFGLIARFLSPLRDTLAMSATPVQLVNCQYNCPDVLNGRVDVRGLVHLCTWYERAR